MRHTLIYLAVVTLTAPVSTAGAQISVRDRIIGAIDLPRVVDSVRKRGGIPEDEIRIVIEDVRRRRIPASETRDVLDQTDAAIREHGPVDNFGAFVQSRLGAGLRGRALAQAIRQEHARRGIGKGNSRSTTGRVPQDTLDRARGKASDQSTTGKGKGKGRP